VLARALARTCTPIGLRLGTNLSTAMAGRGALQRALRFLPIRLSYSRIERIIAVSAGVAEDTARIARVPRSSIAVIPNPVITPELAAQAGEPCDHPWLRPGEPPVIMGSGRFQRQKDFPTLLRAFARVRGGRVCRLIILGEGKGRAGLESLVRELGLSGEVDLPGFVPNPYPLIARAALFVLSSAWEGSPNVLTEALALGVPAVSTDCPSGPAEILGGGRFGPLVPVGDVAALADAMERTLASPLPRTVLKAAVADYGQAASARHYLTALGLRD
jgi:glycosyltransferase involved in cell wall biosynthesis